MPRQRAFRQLRIQYSLRYVAIFALASLALTFLLLQVSDQRSMQSHAGNLLAVADRTATELRALDEPWTSATELGPSALKVLENPSLDDFFLAFVDDRENTLWQCKALRANKLPLPGTDRPDQRDFKLDYFDAASDASLPRFRGRLGVAATEIVGPNGQVLGTLLVGQSTEAVDQGRTSRRWLLVFFFLSSLVVVGCLIWHITGRWLRPLRDIAEQAAAITPTKIEKRLEINTSTRELQDLVGAMNNMLTRIESGYQRQQQFISNVSHELRTPLTVLLGETRTTLTRYQPDAPEAELARKVSIETRRMIDLVDGFMILARSSDEAGVPTELLVTIEDVVLNSIGREREYARKHNVKVVPRIMDEETDASLVRGDSDLLVSMCTNLIRNAVRHSPEGGIVHVEMAQTSDRQCIEVIVRDEGKGIPETELENIFEVFHQVDPVRNDVGTGGIGLAIVRAVAEQHGGTVNVRNVYDKGCEFRVRLPLAQD